MVAQGASPAPVPVPPTLALPSRRPSPKRRYARRSPCGHRRRLCSRPPLTFPPLARSHAQGSFCATCTGEEDPPHNLRRADDPPTASRRRPPHHTPSHPSPITHTLLSIHLHTHNSLHPLPSAPLVTPPPSTPAQVSPWTRASGMGWYSSFFVFIIA